MPRWQQIDRLTKTGLPNQSKAAEARYCREEKKQF